MNKVVNINLNGIILSIDEVAYEQLKQYIDALHKHFAGTEGAAEIISDIETRIAELLQLKIKDAYTVILSKDVSDVIAIMGNPWEMDGDEEQEQKSSSTNSSNQSSNQNTNQNFGSKKLKRDPHNKIVSGVCGGIGNFLNIDPIIARAGFLVSFFVFGTGFLLYIILWVIMPEATPDELPQFSGTTSRKLFRNTDNKAIGGVCSGIAAYLGTTEVAIRVVFVIAFFAFGTGLLAYLLLWIIIPPANTSTEKLQMKGNNIDINNIEREIRNAATNISNKATASPVLTRLVKLVTIVIGLMVLLMIVVPSSILFILLLFSVDGGGDFADFIKVVTINDTILLMAKWGTNAIILSVILGFFSLAYQLITHKKIKYLSVVTTILFFVGVVITIAAVFNYRSEIKNEVTFVTNEQELAVNDTLLIKLNPKFLDDDVDEFDINFDNGKVSWKMQNGMLLFEEPRLTIKASTNNLMQVKMKRESWGSSKDEAEQLANDASLNVIATSQSVVFDNGVSMGDHPFKNQKITLGLWLPVGTIVKMQYEALEFLKDEAYADDFDEDDIDETQYAYFKVTNNGLVYLPQPKSDWEAQIEIEETVTDSLSNDKKTKVVTRTKKVGPVTFKKTKTIETK